MKSRLPSIRSTALVLFAFFLLFLLLANAELAMDGVRQGLSLCTETLFPSLFPFLVFSELLVVTGVGEGVGRLFSRPVGALFGLSRSGSVALLLGWLCGSPVGTATALSLWRRGEIEERELARLTLFANNPSSGFLISAVGGALFGNTEAGVALFLITTLSAALVGLFLRLCIGRADGARDFPTLAVEHRLRATDFTGSVKRGFATLLQVAAFVLFFSCISKCLSPLLSRLALPQPLSVLLCGLLEMTAGISAAVTDVSPARAFRLTAFFASFAGLSVCLQIFSIAEEASLALLPYLAARLSQGLVALGLAEGYLRLFRPDFITAESVDTISPLQGGSLSLALILSLVPLSLLALHLIIKKAVRPRATPR